MADAKPSFLLRILGSLGGKGSSAGSPAPAAAPASSFVSRPSNTASASNSGRSHPGLANLHGRYTWVLALWAAVVNFRNVTRGIGVFAVTDLLFMNYVLIALFATFFFYRDPEDQYQVRTLFKFLLLSLFAYGFPVLIVKVAPYIGLTHTTGNILMLIAPVWVLYVFLNPGETGDHFSVTRFIAFWYFLALSMYIIMGIILPTIGDNAPQYSVAVLTPSEAIADLHRVWLVLKSTAHDTTVSVYTTGKDVVKNNINQTVPELFVGQVDQTQGAPIGVSLTDTQPLYDKFRIDVGDSVIVTTTLKSRTLSLQEQNATSVCQIEASDYASVSVAKQIRKGTVNPEKVPLIYSGDQQDARSLECDISNADMKLLAFTTNSVSADVNITTTFPFVTTGYVTYAFMDRDLYSRYRTDNKDPALQMGLTSNRQVAKYTPGPVQIGMPTDTLPFPFDPKATDSNANAIPPFGVTFSRSPSVVRGGIQSFSGVYVYLPTQLAFAKTMPTADNPLPTTFDCSPGDVNVIEVPAGAMSMGPQYHAYKLDLSKTHMWGQGMVTVRCRMVVADGQVGSVLGPSGTSVYTILVDANYTFSVETRTPVQLMVTPVPTNRDVGIGAPNVGIAKDRQSCLTSTPVCTPAGGACFCVYSNQNDVPVSQQKADTPVGVCSFGQVPDRSVFLLYNAGTSDSTIRCTQSTLTVGCMLSAHCDSKAACSCVTTVEGKTKVCKWTPTNVLNPDCTDYTQPGTNPAVSAQSVVNTAVTAAATP